MLCTHDSSTRPMRSIERAGCTLKTRDLDYAQSLSHPRLPPPRHAFVSVSLWHCVQMLVGRTSASLKEKKCTHTKKKRKKKVSRSRGRSSFSSQLWAFLIETHGSVCWAFVHAAFDWFVRVQCRVGGFYAVFKMVVC